MRLVLPFLAALGFATPFAVAPSHAASFNCAKANAPDERAICNDADLSIEDEKLADLYTRLSQRLNGKKRQELVASQHAWLRARAKCRDDLVCLTSEYDSRTKQLQPLLGESAASAKPNASAKPGASALDTFRRTGQCRHCNLSGASLSGIEPAAHADGGKLQCTVKAVANGTFDRARIDHANFVSCDTKYDSALSSMSWDRASLKGTDFTGTNLGGNSFKQANLTGANLSDANLFWVDMSNAKLARANLTGAQSTPDAMNGICSDFTNADFSGAKAEKAELCGSFYNANFTGANLRGAKIYGSVRGLSKRDANAYAVETDPSDTDTSPSTGRFGGKINLTGADLRGATLFSEKKLTPHGYAFAILCRTKMPDGTTSNRDCK